MSYDSHIIVHGMKCPLQMDTVISCVPFVHAFFNTVANIWSSYTIRNASTTNVYRRTHILYYVTVTFQFYLFFSKYLFSVNCFWIWAYKIYFKWLNWIFYKIRFFGVNLKKCSPWEGRKMCEFIFLLLLLLCSCVNV